MAIKDLLQKLKNIFKKDTVSISEVNNNLPESEKVIVAAEVIEENKEVNQNTQTLSTQEPTSNETKVEAEPVNEQLKEEIKEEINTEVKELDSSSEINETSHVTNKTSEEKPIILPSQKQDSSRRFIQIDISKLELQKIWGEAETITAYSKLLAKDIALFKEEKSEDKLNSIQTKFRMIYTHTNELKNLISTLNELFYVYLLNNLSETNPVLEQIKKGQEQLDKIQSELTKLATYDELFNSEKTPDFENNLKNEIEKGEFNKEVNDLGKFLMENINNKKTSINGNVNEVIFAIKQSKEQPVNQ